MARLTADLWVAAYLARLRLADSPLGGLRVDLTLPAVQ